MTYLRAATTEILESISKNIQVLHVISGPRQVGKSTAAEQIASRLNCKAHFAVADSPVPFDAAWIEAQWNIAAALSAENDTLLIFDEIQKINGWSEVVKKLWDETLRKNSKLKVLILGSAALLIQQGLSESLAGRFLMHRFTHWTFKECKEAFDWNLNKWIIYGGYPGAAKFTDDNLLWKKYVNDSLIETVISRDVLQLQTVQKPALLKNLFGLATAYPAQIISYNKMLGQLQDAGNTTTLAHYLKLLESAFLISGLEQFSKGSIKRRGSSPKLVLWNNALITAPGMDDLNLLPQNTTFWGRLIENAVGSHLLNQLQGFNWRINYWNDGKYEVDYVVSNSKFVFAIEVKSGRSGKTSGLQNFKQKYRDAKLLIVGSGGIGLEDFFSEPVSAWLR